MTGRRLRIGEARTNDAPTPSRRMIASQQLMLAPSASHGFRWFIPAEGNPQPNVALAMQRSLDLKGMIKVGKGEEDMADEFGYWITAHRELSSSEIYGLELIQARYDPVPLAHESVWGKKRRDSSRSSDRSQTPPAATIIHSGKQVRLVQLEEAARSSRQELEPPTDREEQVQKIDTSDGPPLPNLAAQSTPQEQALNDIAVVLANLCGWQIDSERFLWQGQPNSVPLLTERGRLGQGSIGEVYEVKVRTINHRTINPSKLTMARKSIAISRRRRIASRELDLIREEIANMRSLSHPHVVQVLGCYQEGEGTRDHFFHVLMFPVGDQDLGTFLEDRYDASEGSPHELWLRAWFSCLTSALAYMHSKKIHHEDIKPKNIIHRGERVMFTDFSSSRKFESGQETSTANPARASRLFAAPEALPTEDGIILRHGSKTDIFSLGLVFVEMLTVLCGQAIDDLHDGIHTAFPGFDDNWERRQYHRVVAYFSPWFASTSGSFIYDIVIQPMLVGDRKERASANAVLALLSQQLPICQCTSTHHQEVNQIRPQVSVDQELVNTDRYHSEVLFGQTHAENGLVNIALDYPNIPPSATKQTRHLLDEHPI